uniref:Uncharacterized protein n=1 Tax=Anguilla anguilla TaxID=7936 RepID=A0A0E9TXV6_ANGAN
MRVQLLWSDGGLDPHRPESHRQAGMQTSVAETGLRPVVCVSEVHVHTQNYSTIRTYDP